MTIDMVKNVISKLKFDKAAGPSGVVVEMVRTAGANISVISQWQSAEKGSSPLTGSRASFRLPLQEKGCFALGRCKFRGLKLTEQAIKVTERIADSLNRQAVTIAESQFGFVPGAQQMQYLSFAS